MDERMPYQDPSTKSAHAIRYTGVDDSPEVMVSGKGTLADIILAIAKAHDIPIEQHPTLSEILQRESDGPIVSERALELLATIFSHLITIDKTFTTQTVDSPPVPGDHHENFVRS